MHRIIDYCVMLQHTPAQKLKENERQRQICGEICTLIYRRDVYRLEEDRKVDELLNEFFSLELKKGSYSFDDSTFDKIKYIDFLYNVSTHGWLVCKTGHIYHAVDENDVTCSEC